jgi:hypothetical protein
MWKEVEHVILAPEKVIDEIVDVFLLLVPGSWACFLLSEKESKGDFLFNNEGVSVDFW